MSPGVDVNEAGELFALCKHGGKRQRIPLVDLFLPAPPPAGADMDRSVSPSGGAAVIVAATPADKALIRHRHQRGKESAVNHRSGEIVPKSLKPIYVQIVGMTDTFCHQHLDSDFAGLCIKIKMAAALARQRPSP